MRAVLVLVALHTSLAVAEPRDPDSGGCRRRFALRVGTAFEREWHERTLNAVASAEATWRFARDKSSFEVAVGARAPYYHQSDFHIDVISSVVGSLELSSAPLVRVGIGPQLVLLTGILFFGHDGIEGDGVGQVAVRVLENSRITYDLVLRVEQSFASYPAFGCVSLAGSCGDAQAEYPFRAGLWSQIAFL